MKILLIEDDRDMSDSIELILATEGIVCERAEIGEDGIKIGKISDFDLIILDLMLPDISGIEVLLRLRSVRVKTPILILSGIATAYQKVISLRSGADDYLTKPFYPKELIARIKSIIRRSQGHSESVVKFGQLSINLDTRLVEVSGKRVHLTNKEYAILELLVLRRGTVLTKEKFLEHLYNNNEEPEVKAKIIDVFMCKLRKKLSDAGDGEEYINTTWGRGYSIIEPEAEVSINNEHMALDSKELI